MNNPSSGAAFINYPIMEAVGIMMCISTQSQQKTNFKTKPLNKSICSICLGSTVCRALEVHVKRYIKQHRAPSCLSYLGNESLGQKR